jgi:hypothetical protein
MRILLTTLHGLPTVAGTDVLGWIEPDWRGIAGVTTLVTPMTIAMIAAAVLPDQPGERLLRDVLGIVGAEQVGQPHHLRVPGAEEPGDLRGRVLGSEAPGIKLGMQVCRAP